MQPMKARVAFFAYIMLLLTLITDGFEDKRELAIRFGDDKKLSIIYRHENSISFIF
ncbi:hypothetical protein D3C71_1748180 [compost metagenome]